MRPRNNNTAKILLLIAGFILTLVNPVLSTGLPGGVAINNKKNLPVNPRSAGGTDLYSGSNNPGSTLAPPTITTQPVGGIICAAGSIDLVVAATGTGILNYQWKKDGANTGTNTNSLTAASAGIYTVTITDDNGTITSTDATVTVGASVTYYQDADGDGFGNPSVTTQACNGVPPGYAANNKDCNDAIATIDPSIFGGGFWNVFAYQGTSYENYYGYYTDHNLDLNTTTYWNGNGSPSDATGYIGCVVPPDGHSYKAKRRGFTPGCYIISIPSHDDNTTLYVDGVIVFQHNGCCDGHSNIWTGELNASSTVEFNTQEGGGYSNAWLTFASSAKGTISGDQVVCIGSLPANISLTGVTSTIQWQSSSNNISFSDIAGATATTLPGTTIGTISSTFYIRAITSVGTCLDTSAVITLSTQALPTAAIAGVATGYDSVTLTASGGNSYLWSGGKNIASASNTFYRSLGYTVIVFDSNGCTDTASIVVQILRLAVNRYGAANTDSASHLSATGAIGTPLSVDKNGKIRNAIINDGKSETTAGSSAYQIKQDFPASTDGLYWIKNANINSGTPFQIYADMTTNGGGWTLILCNKSPNPGWSNANALLRNENSPNINATYSIIAWADYIKKSSSGFQYMIDAQTRGSHGGIWTANSSYSFVSTSNNNSNITLDTKFGSWNYNNDGIEERMPWYAPGSQGIITTSSDANGSWWGTLIAAGGWNPAPWLGCCGMGDPGIIWYWVR